MFVLGPLKRQPQKWNKWFKNKASWINKKEKNLPELDKKKESLAAAVCNRAA